MDMAEYGSKQRNQHSKIISGSESKNVQLQRFADNRPQTESQMNLIRSIQKKPNNTDLPDSLKSGVENLSGYSMDGVKVHNNSLIPLQLTMQMYGVNINNDKESEIEANDLSLTKIEQSNIKYKIGETKGALLKYIQKNKNLKTSTAIVQRVIAKARAFRAIALSISSGVDADFAGRTVGVSNNMFAITPQLGGSLQQRTASMLSGGRGYAGAVPGGGRAGNHAERKLIFYDPGLSEIGVDRGICSGCVSAICANRNIRHVSEPGSTYQVTPTALERVGN